MLDEFVAAEDFLERAGLLETELPIPLERVTDYLAKEGLELRYYNPSQAPEAIKDAAFSVDEVLVYQKEGALLFVNRRCPSVRKNSKVNC